MKSVKSLLVFSMIISACHANAQEEPEKPAAENVVEGKPVSAAVKGS
jgi:hypothetical protein